MKPITFIYCVVTAGLLSVQLAITAATVAWFTLHTPTKMYVFANPWIFWTSFTVSFVTMLAMGLSEKLRRQWPTNIVLLGVFTLCESVLVGTIAAMYAPQVRAGAMNNHLHLKEK